MPNFKRAEVINIGIVIFRKKDIDVKVLQSLSKIRIIDGSSTINDLSELVESMIDIANYAGDNDSSFDILKSFYRNNIYLSGLGSFSLKNINDYDSTVEKLFSQLVEPVAPKRKRVNKPRLITSVKNYFKKISSISSNPDDIEKNMIVENYPINKHLGVDADFMAKNGVYHLSNVVDFNVSDKKTKHLETSSKVLSFIEGKKAFPSLKRHFVYSATSHREIEMEKEIRMAENYCENIFNLHSKSEKKKYEDLMSAIVQHDNIF